ncbi:LysM peptidoglycan-binding domain-containing protein [Salipaludibacillus sp. HK11]|uniref:cell wall hydrolase n=1 Tax=Salipaludibacillus sp. HK11 TaxID=3394320 RepID=UPI0039FBBD57
MKKIIVMSALMGMFLLVLQEEVSASSYEVRSGDSLWTISQKYGVTIEGLKRQNNLSHNEIRPGQALIIPNKGVSHHTVQRGETLWIIANHHAVTVSQLRNWNGISGSLIYPGQTLTISESNQVNNVGEVNGYSEAEGEVLARLVEAEAKSESYEGKVAVASVVLNRVNHNGFPSSIFHVIYETYDSGSIYAFEPVQNGTIRGYASSDSIQAVEEAMKGYDPTNGAIYFFNPDTATSEWVNNLTISQRIGNHVFAK